MECHITAEVHCHWSESPPVYRIFVDDEMLLERVFAYPGYNNAIEENIICDLPNGIHSIRLENITGNGNFKFQNIKVMGNNIVKHPNYDDPNGMKWTFIVTHRN